MQQFSAEQTLVLAGPSSLLGLGWAGQHGVFRALCPAVSWRPVACVFLHLGGAPPGGLCPCVLQVSTILPQASEEASVGRMGQSVAHSNRKIFP